MTTIDKTEDDELDLFSQDSLTIAGKFKAQFPDTWKLLYDNRGMPDLVQFVAQYATTKAEQLAADIMEGLKGLEIDLQATEKHIESTGLTGDKVAERMLQVEIEADDRKVVLDDVRSIVQKLREAPNV